MIAVARLLDRLHGVRETGPDRWIARCPAHEDGSPSLSIRETDDGCVLLHCFGGCDSGSVLGAVGLEFRDLYPPRNTVVPFRRASVSRIPAVDALAALDHEAQVIAVIGADVRQHRELDEATWQRLALAVRRIGEARAMTAPLRVKP